MFLELSLPLHACAKHFAPKYFTDFGHLLAKDITTKDRKEEQYVMLCFTAHGTLKSQYTDTS